MERFINDDIKVSERRTAATISEDEFKQKLCDAVLSHCGQDDFDEMMEYAMDEPDENDPLPWGHAVSFLLNCSYRIMDEKDISVDHENIMIDWGNWAILHTGTAEPAKYLGVHTINGLTFCGALTSGDWEDSVFVILYWDGEDIHIYIPKRGNAVNMDAMTAFGSENDEFENWGWDAGERFSALGKEAIVNYRALGLCGDDIVDEDDFFWSELYIRKYGYSLNENGYVDIPMNWEAMMNEIHECFTII